MSFKKFQASNTPRYEKFLNENVGQSASKTEKARQAHESVFVALEGSVNVTTSKLYTKQETVVKLFPVDSGATKGKLDLAWANAIVNDGLPLTVRSSKNWKQFWSLTFGGSWKALYRRKMSGPLLDQSYEENFKTSTKRYQ